MISSSRIFLIFFSPLTQLFVFLDTDTTSGIACTSCAVPNCNDTQSPRQYFPHPQKDKKRYQDWIQLVSNSKLEYMDPLEVYQNYRVCTQHFHFKYILSNYKLSNDALPKIRMPRFASWKWNRLGNPTVVQYLTQKLWSTNSNKQFILEWVFLLINL